MKETQEHKYEGFDRVFPLIGGHHLFQWFLLGVTSLQGCLLSFHHLGYVFLAAIPAHWCEIEEFKPTNWTMEQIKNISIPHEVSSNTFVKCERYDLNYSELAKSESFMEAFTSIDFSQTQRKPCIKWTYDESIYHSTTVTQFDLVCDRQYLVATIQASYMAGVFLGSFVMGGLSDKVLGRKNTVLLSITLAILCGFGAAFSTSYTVFVIFRLFLAVGVTVTEYSDTSYRALMGMLQSVPFGIGHAIMPVFAYFIRDWSFLQLAFTFTTLTLLSYFWTLPESSRWLASQGRENEALKILLGIAKQNKMPDPNHIEICAILKDCRDQSVKWLETKLGNVSYFVKFCQGLSNVLGNYWNLLRTSELRKRSIILWILYTSVTLVYYGVSFDSAMLTDDPFLIVSLGGLMEIPGYLGVVPFVARWGRRPTVATTFLLSGVSCILVALTPFEYKSFRIIFSMAGKLFISGCFSTIYLLGTELYPTTTRATGLSCAVLMGRIGSIIAPYVVSQMKNVYSDMPSIIFGVTGIIAGLIAFFLPETKDVEMMESIDAIENMPRTNARSNSIQSIRFLPRTSLSNISDEFKSEATVFLKLQY